MSLLAFFYLCVREWVLACANGCVRVRACASGCVRGPEQLLLVNEQWCRGMCGGVQFELGAIL